MKVILENETIFKYYPQLETQIAQNPAEAVPKIREAVREFRRQHRADLMAEAYYYMAEAHFRMGDARKLISNALHGIGYVRQSTGAERLLPKLYNIAGIGYSAVGEYSVSQQYYMDGLQYATSMKDEGTKLSLENNIGSLLVQLGDCKEALQFASRAYTEALKLLYAPEFDSLTAKEKAEREEMFYATVLNMAGIAYHEEDYETSLRYLDQLSGLQNDTISRMYDNHVATVRAKVYLASGNTEAVAEIIDELHSDEGEEDRIGENSKLFEDFQEIAELLIKEGEKELAWSMLELMLEVCQAFDNAGRWATYYDLLARYYEEWGEEREFFIACVQYHKFSSKNMAEFQRSMLTGIKNQLEVNRSVQRQKLQAERAEELRLLSEIDELTNLLNRRSFNKLSQNYFTAAVDNRSSFGLIMLDVDFFKQYNDHYGHVAGDECLKMVSGILHESDGNGFLSSRYGGDEFIIIVRDCTDDEIRKHMEDILSKVRERKVEHCKSEVSDIVTVTMGAVNLIPQRQQTVMDIVQLADDALYEAKRRGKNQTYMAEQ